MSVGTFSNSGILKGVSSSHVRKSAKEKSIGNLQETEERRGCVKKA